MMAGLFLVIGHLLGGMNGVLIALFLALAFNVGTFFYGEKMALKFVRARPLARHEAPWLHELNDELSRRAGMPPAKLHVSPDPQPNAFACGRGPGHASICVNAGLLNNLDRREVAGVLAHEIAHVKHRDTLIMTIVATVATAITFLAYFALFFGGRDRNPIVGLVIFLLAPIAATIVQMAVSRAREYAADARAAHLLKDPLPLADALESLSVGTERVRSPVAQQQTAHMYIANPLSGRGMSKLFSTHPPMQERVRRLRAMKVA